LVSKAHKNKIPTARPITYVVAGLNRVNLFNGNIIFTSPGVANTPEINMADKTAEVV